MDAKQGYPGYPPVNQPGEPTPGIPVRPPPPVYGSPYTEAYEPLRPSPIYRADNNQAVNYSVVDGYVVMPNMRHAVRMYCPHCHSETRTKVRHRAGLLACLCSALLCFTPFWCCFCLPCCAVSCLDHEHTCNNCGATLAVVPAGSH